MCAVLMNNVFEAKYKNMWLPTCAMLVQLKF